MLKDLFYHLRFEFYSKFDKEFYNFYQTYINAPVNDMSILTKKYSVKQLQYLVIIQSNDNGRLLPFLEHKLKSAKAKKIA